MVLSHGGFLKFWDLYMFHDSMVFLKQAMQNKFLIVASLIKFHTWKVIFL